MAFHFLFIAGIAVVYDSIEPSPYYGGTANDMYLDEKELIELPSPHQNANSQIKEPYQKRYYFNPMNLPYNLEQSSQYSCKQMPVSENKVSFGVGKTEVTGQNRGPRLNRYYASLKPYYKLKDPVYQD